MADEKKYTAREAAIAVLQKASELLHQSSLVKAENPDKNADAELGEKVEHLCEDHMLENKSAEKKEGHKIVAKAECMKCMKSMTKSEFTELYADLEKMSKGEEGQDAGIKEDPSNSQKPRIGEKETERDYKDFETKPGSSKTSNDNRQAEQTPPGQNPKEQAEGNNPPAGAVPGNGVMKLAYFMGHRHAKKKMKKGIAVS